MVPWPDGAITSVYLRGMDNTEIVLAVHARPAPMIRATHGLYTLSLNLVGRPHRPTSSACPLLGCHWARIDQRNVAGRLVSSGESASESDRSAGWYSAAPGSAAASATSASAQKDEQTEAVMRSRLRQVALTPRRGALVPVVLAGRQPALLITSLISSAVKARSVVVRMLPWPATASRAAASV
jgi:hypothetical protein